MEFKKKLICKTEYPEIDVNGVGIFINKQIVEVDIITADKLMSTGYFQEIKEEIKKKGGK